MGWSFGWNQTRKDMIWDLTRSGAPNHNDSHIYCKHITHCCRGNNLWGVWHEMLNTMNPDIAKILEAPLCDVPLFLDSEYRTIKEIAHKRLAGKPVEELIAEPVEGFISLHIMANSKDGWGNKGLSESSGPYYINVPKSYLDLAQPAPKDDFSVRWRERVKDYYANRSRKLKVGVKYKYLWSRDTNVTVVLDNLKPLLGYISGDWKHYRLKRDSIGDPVDA